MLKVSRLLPAVSYQTASRAFVATGAISSPESATVPNGDVAFEAAKPYSSVPGPNAWELFKWFRPGGKLYGKQVFEIQEAFYEKYGNLSKLPGIFGKPDFLFVYEPEDMEKVYRYEGQYPIREGLDSITYFRTQVRKDIYGKGGGLTTDQGEAWWNFRHKVNPVMMKPKVIKMYVPKLDDISKDFVKKLDESLSPDGTPPDDLLTLFNKWTLESVCYISLDTRIGLLGDKENPEALRLMQTLKLFFDYMYKLDILPSIWKVYKTPTFKAAMKNLNEMTDLALHFMAIGKKTLEEKKKSNNQTDRESGVLEKLLEIDENVALVMTVDSILAGIDTTTATTFQLLHALALFPEKQEILRKEILSIIPDEDSKLTPENMNHMPYLRACFKESARYDPIFGPVRSVGKDMVLQGYQIPYKTVCMMAQAMQLRNEKYIEKADQFIPERFLRQTEAEATGCPVKQRDFHPFLFLPFGFGPRMCIGKRFAELEMETAICRLLQKYRVEWDGPEPTYMTAFGKIPIGKTHFKFKKIQ